MDAGFHPIMRLRSCRSKRPVAVMASLFNLMLLCSVLSSSTFSVGAARVRNSVGVNADVSTVATTFSLNSSSGRHRHYSKLEIARAQRHLKALSEATVQSIKSPDGDIIDCVLREKQPAFHHPFLKNHTIQEFPSSIPDGMRQEESASAAAAGAYSSSLYGTQLWHRNGRCPTGTVPIRRPPLSNLLDTRHQQSLRRLRSIDRHNISRTPTIDIKLTASPQHEYAVAKYMTEPIYGTSVILSVWNPSMTQASEMSLAQLWLSSGNYEGTKLDTIEAGWMVQPLAYGDTNTRFFIFWTNDAYNGNGCLDLTCPGFVHVSSDMVLGGTLEPVSTYKGSRREMQPILVWKETSTKNWWLRIGTTNIGYWPSSLFRNGLSQSADKIEWGGEIVNTWPGGRHTNTQMGSGHFASEGFGGASFARSLSMVNSYNRLSSIPLRNLTLMASNQGCYDIQSTSYDNWGSTIFFGGPGLNPSCP